MKSYLACILCAVLIAAMALSVIGCTQEKNEGAASSETVTTVAETTTSAETTTPVKGEGSTVFTFVVTFADQSEKTYEIHTDKKTVGEALLDVGLIQGEEGQYGLYVKTVDGVTADYDVDQTYWAFYVGNDYAMTGVDQTEIVAGTTYAFKIAK